MAKTAAYRWSRSPIALAAVLCLSLADCAQMAAVAGTTAQPGTAPIAETAETGSAAGDERYWDPDRGMVGKPTAVAAESAPAAQGNSGTEGGNKAATPKSVKETATTSAPPAPEHQEMTKPDKEKLSAPGESAAATRAMDKETVRGHRSAPPGKGDLKADESALPVKGPPPAKTAVHQKDAGNQSKAAAKTKAENLDGFELKSQTPMMAPLDSATTSNANGSPAAPNDSANGGKNEARAKIAGEDNYPTVEKMESLTFGAPQSGLPIEARLEKLEQAVFQKTFATETLFDRTEKLKQTLLGAEEDATREALTSTGVPLIPFSSGNAGGASNSVDSDYFDSLAQRPENQQRVPKESLKTFALEAINYERGKLGLAPVELDEIATKVAQEHVDEMCKRNLITHNNLNGDNPDRRYTIAGGNGAVTESIVSNKTPDTVSQSPTKAAVINILKTMVSRQDDHDAIFNPESTHIGFALDWTPGKDKLIAATEVVTRHGIIHPLPLECKVGEKVEVKGVVLEPYKFERVTLAWEANHDGATVADDSEEALPYFPPLDYAAYANKSEHDYSTAMGALRTAGIIAAIAGGFFIPPVALAAPLIAMSGGMGEPKPVSDIPVHSGMKLEGSTFSGKITLNKEGKEGIYYVTVWASTGKYSKPIPISRQAIIARGSAENVSAAVEQPGHEKKSKKVKQASAQP